MQVDVVGGVLLTLEPLLLRRVERVVLRSPIGVRPGHMGSAVLVAEGAAALLGVLRVSSEAGRRLAAIPVHALLPMPHLVHRVRSHNIRGRFPSRRVGGFALSMGSRSLPPIVVVHVDDLKLGAVLHTFLARRPSQREVHFCRSHVIVVSSRLNNLDKEGILEIRKVECLGSGEQLCHLWFAGRRGVGTVIRVPVDPSVHPVPMLLGTKSTSRDVTPPQPRNIKFQIPGGVGRPSSYLFVGCQAGRVALGSSVHQELSTRPEHKSQRCVNPDISDIEDLGRGEVYLVARQELLVDNRMHCVVLGGDRLYAEVVRAEMNKMHIRNSLHET